MRLQLFRHFLSRNSESLLKFLAISKGPNFSLRINWKRIVSFIHASLTPSAQPQIAGLNYSYLARRDPRRNFRPVSLLLAPAGHSQVSLVYKCLQVSLDPHPVSWVACRLCTDRLVDLRHHLGRELGQYLEAPTERQRETERVRERAKQRQKEA